MFDILYTIISFLLALTILVAIHEWGHLYVASLCGVKVLRFSVGFGQKLFARTDKHGTEFAISAIPLGGYVKMLDEREMEVSDEEKQYSYNSKSVWQRISILSAGPIANFILALFLNWLVYWSQGVTTASPVIGDVTAGSIAAEAGLEVGQEIIAVDGIPTPSRREVILQLVNRLGESGEISFTVQYPDSDLEYVSVARLDRWLEDQDNPELLEGLGLEFYYPATLAIIDKVSPQSPAERAGFISGDQLLAVDGVELPSWRDWVAYVQKRPNENLSVELLRDQKRLTLPVMPEAVEEKDGTIGRVGMQVKPPTFPEEMLRRHKYGFFGAWLKSVEETWDTAGLVLISMKKLILGQISTKNLSGPIGIAKVAADYAKDGIWTFISFLAYLSVVLGVLNLLPVPVLDGGQIMYCLMEKVKGSPLSEKAQLIGYQAGLAMIICITIVAFYNDILRL